MAERARRLPAAPRAAVVAGLIATSLAACLPSSRRGETASLLPSDSLSRRVAAAATVDSLEFVWRSDEAGFQLPTSIAWLGAVATAGRLAVADTRAGELRLFDAATGAPAGPPTAGLSFPYVAGAPGDSVVVLERGADRLTWLAPAGAGMAVARTVAVPAGATAAGVAGSVLWLKRADEQEAWLVRLDGPGRVVARYPLPGPSWRRIGFLRAAGDSVLSLSGYRPVIDVVGPMAPTGTAPDTIALVGFDSPQLVRSHRYLRGEVDQPPLLTSSAAIAGGRLYVLNLRPDHVRVDVFDAGGRLERVLAYITPAAMRDHFPVDVAVRESGTEVRLALVMQRPGGLLSEPGGYVLMLRWPRPAAAT